MTTVEDVIYIQKKRKAKYKCSLCSKNFHYKKSYDKHVLTCNQLEELQQKNESHPSNISNTNIKMCIEEKNMNIQHKQKEPNKNKKTKKNSLDDMIDMEDKLPTQREMFEMLQTLTLKYENLQMEFDKMKAVVNNRKKRIDILAYLNEPANISPEIVPFKEWMSSFKVNREELEYMFEYNHISGMVQALIRTLPLETSYKHGIKCFDQKKNIYFKYDICEDDDEDIEPENGENKKINNDEKCVIKETRKYKWTIMDDDDFNGIVVRMTTQFLKQFQLWKKENEEEIDTNYDFHEIYVNNMRKVLGSNHEKDRRVKIIKSKLYQYLKCNLKNITQYEFSI